MSRRSAAAAGSSAPASESTAASPPRSLLVPAPPAAPSPEHVPAQVVDRRVVRDLEQPARELPRRVVGVEAAEGLDEDLLRQVLGRARVLDHAHDQAVDRPLEARHQLAEGLLRAGQGARHQLGVGLHLEARFWYTSRLAIIPRRTLTDANLSPATPRPAPGRLRPRPARSPASPCPTRPRWTARPWCSTAWGCARSSSSRSTSAASTCRRRRSRRQKILAGDAPRRMVMHFLYDVSKDQMCEAWNEGLEANTPNASAEVKKNFATLCTWMDGVGEGQKLVLTYVPGGAPTSRSTARPRGRSPARPPPTPSSPPGSAPSRARARTSRRRCWAARRSGRSGSKKKEERGPGAPFWRDERRCTSPQFDSVGLYR